MLKVAYRLEPRSGLHCQNFPRLPGLGLIGFVKTNNALTGEGGNLFCVLLHVDLLVTNCQNTKTLNSVFLLEFALCRVDGFGVWMTQSPAAGLCRLTRLATPNWIAVEDLAAKKEGGYLGPSPACCAATV